ncbi:MAG: ATPase domain-containing protein, partial [Candidatus Porifericomitaceae bacterium WSBS_2022_MAG_OTU9]
MAKTKTMFRCADCGHEFPQWGGRCGECGSWNSMEEFIKAVKPSVAKIQTVTATTIAESGCGGSHRLDTGLGELDRVLGGGLVHDATVLLGGDPGIGKSTLLLQWLDSMHKKSYQVLYASGEESVNQIAERAGRLGLGMDMPILADNHLQRTMQVALSTKPNILAIDSIQTLYSSELSSAPGTV